jgi:hypothetical protein
MILTRLAANIPRAHQENYKYFDFETLAFWRLSVLSRLFLFGLLLFGDFWGFTFDLLLFILYFFTFRTFKSYSSCSVIRYELSENKLVFQIK